MYKRTTVALECGHLQLHVRPSKWYHISNCDVGNIQFGGNDLLTVLKLKERKEDEREETERKQKETGV